jgi:hypothetical protein
MIDSTSPFAQATELCPRVCSYTIQIHDFSQAWLARSILLSIMKLSFFVLAGAALLGFFAAHPGHIEPESELLYKRHFNAQNRRGLEKCSANLEKCGLTSRAAERRADKVDFYRRQLKFERRDTETVANTSHLSNASYTPATPDTVIFEKESTCILNPEGETGPYWVPGEFVRKNLTEGQPGVLIVIEGQFLDVETCEPLRDVWWDLWVSSCLSTRLSGFWKNADCWRVCRTANLPVSTLASSSKAMGTRLIRQISTPPSFEASRRRMRMGL